MDELAKAYEPQKYEDGIYKRWEDSGFFNPDICLEKGVCEKDAETFSIVLPPPNVTGTLHVGHAAMLAIQDVMVRYHRMKGDKTLWVPGTDHAAIATQTKVEKLLIEKGIKEPKKALGREKFLAEVEKFAQESHDTIIHQTKKMGSSLDWSREAFTLDEKRNLAVRTVFKKMYDEGLIYRGHRIVNWCPRCHSTLADDEVEYKSAKTKLYWIKYGPFVLATTRLETKLGDTAVAVHPKDKRYKKMVGKKYMIPGVLGEFEVVVVADEVVDMKFGSGAIKVTPFHSFADYEIAQRHGVAGKQIIDEDGKMMTNCGKYAGMTTVEAREAIFEDMKKMGLIDHVDENYENNLSVCYRCGHTIEPIPSTQWFIDVNKKFRVASKKLTGVKDSGEYSLKELMQAVVKSGQIEIIPERFIKTYFHWIDNLRDWCISRQIWYGHRIPVWYKKSSLPVRITFLRHGESQANLDKVGAGHMDSPLTEKGRESARELGKSVDSKLYEAVYSSDLVRASETAKIVFGDLHKNIVLDKRLREIDFGDMTGKPGGDIDKYRVIGFPNGENYAQVRDRTLSFLSDIIDKHAGQNIAVVAHSGIWKVLENIVHGVNFDFEHLKIHATREPVDYEITGLIYAGVEAPAGKNWAQDADTLDTWFSSGLWTFSALGWPEKADDLKIFHPTSVMETGYDILFFWVARMILMTTYVLGEIPFEKVYLHGLVRDEQGRKMSKSLGNVIDPLDVCEKYGTDAVRLSLLVGNTPGNDMCLSEEKIAGFRNFANKLWNISRFIQLQINNEQLAISDDLSKPEAKTLTDKWILRSLDETMKTVTENIENLNFSMAGEKLRVFTWKTLADWYLEIAKIEGNKQEVLDYVLKTILKLWHPFAPFVTEQIWSDIYSAKDLLMIQKYPSSDLIQMEEAVGNFERYIIPLVSAIRALRADLSIPPSKRVRAIVDISEETWPISVVSVVGRETKKDDVERMEFIKSNVNIIVGLGRLEHVDFTVNKFISGSRVSHGITVFIDSHGMIDHGAEAQRLEKEIEGVKKYVDNLEKKLSHKDFISRAPTAVVENEKKKLEEAEIKLNKLEEQLKSLK